MVRKCRSETHFNAWLSEDREPKRAGYTIVALSMTPDIGTAGQASPWSFKPLYEFDEIGQPSDAGNPIFKRPW